MVDVVVVGAGFSGSVLANRFALEQNKNVLVFDQRDHIGGNCYDRVDSANILIHPYGPHLFHTDNLEVVDFLSNFTQWSDYEHRVQGVIDSAFVPLPFNFTSITTLFEPDKANGLITRLQSLYAPNEHVSIYTLRNHEDDMLRELGRFVYEKVFLHYTLKQWGITPDEIDPAVLNRVPVRMGYDDRYFVDSFQKMPRDGYTPIFEKMLDHEKISVELSTPYQTRLQRQENGFLLDGKPFNGTVVFTGMIDELFDYQFGTLDYRSLDFDFETLDQAVFQPTTTVNYPNDHDFTRITEFKHMYNTQSDKTTIMREYPKAYQEGKDIPYYPLFNERMQKLYEQYKALANSYPNLLLAGRLAEFKYYDMDDAILNALELFKKFNAR
jgi:UDP-galactopyranose mutase